MSGRVRAGRLDGEVAVVTGSTSGLGKEIARRFALEGAAVLVTGRNEARGRSVVDDIVDAGGRAAFLAADLTDEEDRRALIDGVAAAFGRLTVLVNNAVLAGVVKDGPVADVGPEAWDTVFAIDIGAVAALCRLAVPAMQRAGHGSIVNISSRTASLGTPGLAAYSAAKGALNALTRSITADYARLGIRCNTVQPGYILHDVRDAQLSGERLDRVKGMHLTRLPTAADVAHAVVYLASREAEVVSGITLPVDGGSTAVRGLTLG
jgi:NAD(P)-dependent dehydrogenase (short-subunit alcohol dehydrogenase family)